MAKYSDIKGFTVQTVSTDPVASAVAGGAWASGGNLPSVLYENGADDLEVSRRLGHSNTNITQNIYTHLTANKKRETANKVGDALKKV